MRPTLRVLLALPLLLLCAACADSLPQFLTRVEVRRVVVTPPADLLSCRDAPAVPDPASSDDRAVAGYLVDLWSAGADCRAKLGAVKGFVDQAGQGAP